MEILDAEFDGESSSRPVEVRRSDGTLSQRITYGDASVQDVQNTDLGFFVQDRWRVNDRLLFELGTRLDRNGVVKTLNVAPRAGTVFSVLPDGTGVLRAGLGLFLPETTLNVKAYESYEAPTVTQFDPNGFTARRAVAFAHRLAAKRTPSSLIWNVEYFHELRDNIYSKVNFLRRSGDHELILHPIESGERGVLDLRTDGRSRYWELEWTSRLLARISLVPSTRSWYSCGEEGTDGCVLPGFTDAGTQGQRRRHGVEAGGGEVCGESGVGRPPEAAAARDG